MSYIIDLFWGSKKSSHDPASSIDEIDLICENADKNDEEFEMTMIDITSTSTNHRNNKSSNYYKDATTQTTDPDPNIVNEFSSSINRSGIINRATIINHDFLENVKRLDVHYNLFDVIKID